VPSKVNEGDELGGCLTYLLCTDTCGIVHHFSLGIKSEDFVANG
jgi:hypothetical protein